MESRFVVLFLLSLFFLGAMSRGIDRKGHRPGDAVRVCSYLCMMSKCPDSCRIFVGMKWSRRRSLDSVVRIPKLQFMPLASASTTKKRQIDEKLK